jgi:hypothetical protein
MLKFKVEQHVPPEILEAREEKTKALAEAEHGWDRAQAVIAQRAGLVKDANGSWAEPVEAKVA